MPIQATQVRSLDQEQPRGDQSAPTLTANPFGRSPAPNNEASEYENGFTFGESIDVKVIGTLPPAQWDAWAGRSGPWREGFAAALRGVGLGRFAGNLRTKESSMKIAFLDFALGGPGYSRGQNARLQQLLGAGLISTEEADAMRGDPLDAAAGGARGIGYGALGAGLGAGAGAIVGAIPGAGNNTVGSRVRNIAGSTLGGAALGGALGWYSGAREAGERHVDRDFGNMIDADPTRAEPQFTPTRTPSYGRAAIGAGIGAAIGGFQGKGVKREYPNGAMRSYALPGALAGAALGGLAAYKNPVTSTTPKKPEGESEKKEEPKKESEFWAFELRALKTAQLKRAGMGSDIIGGGAGAVASGLVGGPVTAPLAAGVSGARMGRSSYADEHPEFTERERSVAHHAGGLGSGLAAVGAGGLGAMLGSELGSMGADELTEHGLADGSVPIPGMHGSIGIHEFAPAVGAIAGGLGAADLVGRRAANDAVTRHRSSVALRAAQA